MPTTLSDTELLQLANWAAKMVGDHDYALVPMTYDELEYLRTLDATQGDGRLDAACDNAYMLVDPEPVR